MLLDETTIYYMLLMYWNLGWKIEKIFENFNKEFEENGI